MTKTLSILACGIFRPELEQILEQLSDELESTELTIQYVEAALHVSNEQLEASIAKATDTIKATGGRKNTVLLYGRMCHPEMKAMAKDLGASLPTQANCIELMLEPERKKELDKSGEIFYLTSGWLASWQEIFQQGLGWDEIDARINFGRYDQILVLDSGCVAIDEESIFAFFDYTQVPVEIEAINLSYFKNAVADLIRTA